MKITRNNIRLFLFFLFCLLNHQLYGQYAIRGHVVDEYHQPIPDVDVYIKYSEDTPYKTNANGDFEIRMNPDEVYLILSKQGYEQKELFVPLSMQDQWLNIQLISNFENLLDEVTIKTKRRNIAYEIIQKVVAKRDSISPWNHAHKVNVYIKTIDEDLNANILTKKEKKNEITDDVFDEEERVMERKNFLEVEIEKSFEPFNKMKEKRLAYTLKGVADNMYYQTTVRSDFNFFQNTIPLPDLHQTPILSPISNPGILAYKYKLIEKYKEGNQSIFKIQVTARNTSTSTLSGFIYVVDSLFIVQKIDVQMKKGNLFKYDYFNIQQEYGFDGRINYLNQQKFDYGINLKRNHRKIKTTAIYSDYQFDVKFPKRYFNNELAVTEQDAYEKDSTYWNQSRKAKLTEDEINYIRYKDSVETAHNKKEYLDSVDKEFNRVTFLKVLWYGVDLRNREKKTQWSFNPLVITLRPIFIAGPRIAPGAEFFKKWKNEMYSNTYGEVSFGFLNYDVKGKIISSFLYDPFHSGKVRLSVSHDFEAIRTYDAITQIYKRSNFIQSTKVSLTHEYEVFNGFYTTLNLRFEDRKSLEGYKFLHWLDKALNNDAPNPFESYKASIASLQISYTPGQKYMREPNRKVVLGSKWPIFYAYYEKGIPNVFKSSVDFDYILYGIRQQINISSVGTVSYHIKAGEFLSKKSLKDEDMKYLRRSDPILFSNPMYSFQKLDTLIPTTQRILEAHALYHDNGAILNKIPYVKKARIGLVAGAGYAYLFEGNWWHAEVLIGLERNFRLSRRLLRLGVYYAMSMDKFIQIHHTGKISFSILDNRTMKYNF